MAVKWGPRPVGFDGCWSSWADQDTDVVLRSEMETGFIKTRRRFTGRYRTAQVERAFHADMYEKIRDWFVVYCDQGLLPTPVITPYKKVEMWGFSEPPIFDWPDANVFRIKCGLYQLPAWLDYDFGGLFLSEVRFFEITATSAKAVIGAALEAGAIYWVLSDVAGKPTRPQIRAGQDSSGGAGILSGNEYTTTSVDFDLTGLTASRKYYLFAYQDVPGTGQSEITDYSFTTRSS